jgi:hypothetical protein
MRLDHDSALFVQVTGAMNVAPLNTGDGDALPLLLLTERDSAARWPLWLGAAGGRVLTAVPAVLHPATMPMAAMKSTAAYFQ